MLFTITKNAKRAAQAAREEQRLKDEKYYNSVLEQQRKQYEKKIEKLEEKNSNNVRQAKRRVHEHYEPIVSELEKDKSNLQSLFHKYREKWHSIDEMTIKLVSWMERVTVMREQQKIRLVQEQAVLVREAGAMEKEIANIFIQVQNSRKNVEKMFNAIPITEVE